MQPGHLLFARSSPGRRWLEVWLLLRRLEETCDVEL